MCACKKLKVGVIGCGKISQAYFDAVKTFRWLEITACADINTAVAEAKAKENNVRAMSVEELLADKETGAVLNLTVPAAHVEIGMKCVNAGKHVHSEKPLGADLAEARKLLEAAGKKGVRTGCAPDTFLGGGAQTARKALDDGWIGRPVAGSLNMLSGGPERHPNPGFFYLKGAGPMLDMGPYYITALVNLLGPVRKVCAITARAFDERVVLHPDNFGKRISVEVPTHYAGVVETVSGAVISVTISFDARGGHGHNPIEIYGTEGTLLAPDPNGFGGPVKIKKHAKDWEEMPLTHGYEGNMRGIGLAEMARALEYGRPHRCSGELAFHVLETLLAFEESSRTGRHIEIKSSCERPAPLPTGLPDGMLD